MALVLVLVIHPLLFPLCGTAATLTVTTTADAAIPSAGMLRWAINSANTNANRDTISFTPALTGGAVPARIRLVSALPPLLHPVVIEAVDGSSSHRRTPTVEITPEAGPFLEDGLRVANNSVVRGLALFGFGRQMYLFGASNLVDSCHFGCDAAGEPGAYFAGAVGLEVGNQRNRVVNCVSTGNGGDGMALVTADNCEIFGNFIGVIPGRASSGNGGAGITIDIARTNLVGRVPFSGNIIAGNAKGGILVGSRFPDFSTRSTVIEGNLIGTAPVASEFEGLVPGTPGNGSHGIVVTQNRQITIRRNQIIGNHGHGIFLSGSSAINTVVEENEIGGERPGEPNSGDGIRIFLSGQNFITNNAVVGNHGNGLQLDSSSVNLVVGNRLERNRRSGVYLLGPDNAFAQTAANVFLSNSVSANGGPGFVQLGNASQNRFFINSIFNNGGLGIDLGGTNDADVVVSPVFAVPFTNSFSTGDGWTNVFPYRFGAALTNAVLSNKVVRVGGHFLTTPTEALVSGGLYHLQFYASPYAHPSGFGEGARPVGAFLVGPIPSFNASTNFFGMFTNAQLVPGEVLTATVTRTNNTSTANQTSEFSNGLPLVAPSANRPPVAVADISATAEDTPVDFAVKGNDFDPDGDPITVESVSLNAPGFGFGPVVGTAVLLPNQNVRFTPAANVNRLNIPGPVRITYVINDGRGLKANGVAVVHISPVNDPPKARLDFAATTSPGAVSVSVTANDTDPDGDRLSVIGTTFPSHGTATVGAGGTVNYSPFAGFTGLDNFTYTVSDGAGGTDVARVTVLVRDGASGADLAVLPAVNPPSVAPNQPITFRFGVTNRGPVAATGVFLLVSHSANAGASSITVSQGASTNESGFIQFEIGNLSAGAGASATLVLSSGGAGVVSCTASVQSPTRDAFPQNDRATISATILDGSEPPVAATVLPDRLRLSWNGSAVGFQPEFRRGLDATAPWQKILGPAQSQAGQAFIDLGQGSLTNEGVVVFRLKRP